MTGGEKMKSVIITGADRGLGLSLCKEYLARGYTVFGGKYLDEYNLLENLREKDKNLHIIQLDVDCRESLYKAQCIVSEIAGNKLDMLISNAALMGVMSCTLENPPMDLEVVQRSFSVNALGPARMVEYFLPLLENSEMKRLCFVSSEVACINLMKHRQESQFGYAYPMSKSAMNMAVKLMFLNLFPQGYTFRLYHPGWMKQVNTDGSRSEEAMYDPDFIAEHAAKYFEKPLTDEQRFVMIDFKDREWPF
jgi:NAD(P)-dependent dehydrogenase (short-subunit alcohol dehydrogenase family)